MRFVAIRAGKPFAKATGFSIIVDQMTTIPAKEPPALGFEVMKLLLQVAWADGVIARREVQAIAEQARDLGLSAAELQQMSACLRGAAPLPAPNLGLLRQHRAEVLKVVKRLVQSDGSVSEEEEELLEQISDLLK